MHRIRIYCTEIKKDCQVSQGVIINLDVNPMGFHPSTVSSSGESPSSTPEATYLTRVSICGL